MVNILCSLTAQSLTVNVFKHTSLRRQRFNTMCVLLLMWWLSSDADVDVNTEPSGDNFRHKWSCRQEEPERYCNCGTFQRSVFCSQLWCYDRSCFSSRWVLRRCLMSSLLELLQFSRGSDKENFCSLDAVPFAWWRVSKLWKETVVVVSIYCEMYSFLLSTVIGGSSSSARFTL